MFDKYAPDKLAFAAANPSYNPDYTWENELYPQYIARFCEEIQPSVLSVDFYPFGSGKTLKSSYRIYEFSRADGKHYCINNCTECIHVTLEEGDMVLYRLQNCGEEVFDIEYLQDFEKSRN